MVVSKNSQPKNRGLYFNSADLILFVIQVQSIVDDHKNANITISKDCKKISEMLLIKIDGKRVYDNLEFEEEQVSPRQYSVVNALYCNVMKNKICCTFSIPLTLHLSIYRTV